MSFFNPFRSLMEKIQGLSTPAIVPASPLDLAGRSPSKSLLFIDADVADADQIAQGAAPETEVVRLKGGQDAIEQITQVLQGKIGIESLQIISHGRSGGIRLGESWLDLQTLPGYVNQLKSWGQALSEDADILLYGCNVGQNATGQAFVNLLAQATGADVAASEDVTGNTALGGNWDLEVTQGMINTTLALSADAIAKYQHILPIGPDGGGYIATSTALQSIDLVLGNSGVSDTGLLGDDPTGLPIDLGTNTFRFYGQQYTGNNQLFVNANGLITFGAGIFDYVNTDFTSYPDQAAIGVAWDDWRADNGGNVLYQFRDLNADTVPDELIIEWSTVPHFSNVPAGNATFQAILQLNTGPANGNIIFNYSDMQIASTDVDETGSATIAIKAAGTNPGANRLAVSINSTASPYVGTGKAILITGRLPVVDLNGDVNQTNTGIDYVTSFAQGGGSVAIVDANQLLVTDPDSPNLNSATIQITNLLDGTAESLSAVTTGTNITANYDNVTGILSLSGSDTVSNYQQVLRTVSYDNTAAIPTATNRTVTFTVSDGALASPVATATIQFNSPVLDLNGAAVGRDSTITVLTMSAVSIVNNNLTITDPDSANMAGATVTITNLRNIGAEILAATTTGTNITTSYNSTTGTLSLTGVDTIANYQQVLRSITYTNSAFSPDFRNRLLNFVVSDGSTSSPVTTLVLQFNNAPSFTSNAILAAVPEETTNPPGDTITNLFAGRFSDPNPGASLAGVAIVGNTANAVTQGTWQYSTDGTNWFGVGAVADNNTALALSAATQVRFVPVANYTGTPSGLMVRALDNNQTAFTTGGTRVTLNAAVNGGLTPIAQFINMISTSITNVNDAPSFTGNATLVAIAEDTTNPAGDTVVNLFSGQFSDIDPGASLAGIAIVGNTAPTTEGQWQYSTNGTTWNDIGTVADDNTALALSATTRVRFLPAVNYNGTPIALTVRALDNTQTTFTNGTTRVNVNAAINGGTTAIAATTNTINTNVTATNDLPTGSVTISGTVTEDQTLTAANTLVDVDGLGPISYQWQQSIDGTNWSNVAAGNTLTLGDAQVGKQIRVIASYTDNQGTAETVTSAPTAAVANVNDLPTGTVNISGTVTEDQTLTANPLIIDNDGILFSTIAYQWQQSVDGLTWTNVTGATAANLTLGDDQVGKQIRVMTTYNDAGGALETVISDPTTAVVNVNDAPTGTVTISGTVTEDQPLLAANTIADIDGLGSITYQWQESIDGTTWTNLTTGATLTLGDNQVGKQIRVIAAYTDAQGTAETVTSVPTAAVANVNDLPTGSVTIAGTVTEDQTLTAANTLADIDGLGPITYQWQESTDGNTWTNITGATATTLTLGDAQVGKRIRVAAAYTDARGTLENVNSNATAVVVNVNDLPTGAVTITGTVTEDQILTVSNNLADIDGLGTISYQWQQSTNGTTWNNIAGATGTNLTLGDAQVGKQIRVVATYTDGQNTAETVNSAATAAVLNVNDPATGNVVVSGTATEDQTLTATATVADADGVLFGTIAYQWQQSIDGISWSNIAGATGTTLTLGDAQVNKQIRTMVSYQDGGNTTEVMLSNVTSPVVNINDVPTGLVTVTGTPTEDQILTVANTIADGDGVGTIAYQWQESTNGTTWTNITGATGTTFTLGDAQVGKQIRVMAAYTDLNGTPETLNSNATTPVVNVNDLPVGTVTITGTITEDQTLTVSNNLIDVDGLGTITYQWQESTNGTTWTNIAGATGTTFTLGDNQVGQQIRVAASYIDGQGTSETVNSAATAAVGNVNDLPTGSVTISGTATEDQTLTAANTLADIDGLGAITYQWQESTNGTTWTNITGATAGTFTLGDNQVGKQIRVMAAYTDGQGTLEQVASSATATIANVNDVPTGTVTISGTVTEDQTLTVSNTLADLDGLGAITYQWQESTNGTTWTNITGAIGANFTLGDAQVGKQIRVVAAYTDVQGTSESVNSNATIAVVNVNDVPTGTVTIAGTTTEDQVLTAANTLADVDGLGPIGYQWQQSIDGITWNNITGATAGTFTLGDAQVGQRVRVMAAYTDGQGTAETVASAATAVIVNVNDVPTGAVTISGTVTEDQTLTVANTIADADGMGTVSYQWQQSIDGTTWTNIVGATATSFTLGDAQVDRFIRVVGAYTDLRGTPETVMSTTTARVTNINDVPSGTLTVTGTVAEDQTVSLNNAIIDGDGLGLMNYQWQQSTNGTTWTNITGATGTSLALGDAQVGQQIRVVATYTDGYNTIETFNGTATAAVANVNDVPTGTVTISGSVTEDQILTAANTLADVDGLGTIGYQWQQSTNGTTWTNITGATGTTFTLGDNQVGQQIRVVAAYTDGNGTVEAINSAATINVVNINDAPTGVVTIAGTVTEDQTLTASNSIADADGLGTIGYQWQQSINGTTWTNIAGATGATFTLGDNQVGQQIRVVAAYTDGNGTSETVSSAATAAVVNVNDLPTGAVTIAGTVQENATLTAANNLLDADGLGTIGYQWQESTDGTTWTNITGATGATFTLGDNQVGKQIRVAASYTDGQGTPETVNSAATIAVVNVNDLPTGTVTIAGTVTEDQTLTASDTLADIDGLGTIGYQWQQSIDGVNWSNITGAIGTTLILGDAQVGKQIRVAAAYTDGQGTLETVNSAATIAVANVNDIPTGAVTITGTVAEDQILTVSNNIGDADGLGTITYQWQQSPDGTTWTNITGATTTTLTLGDAQVGQQIQVVAAYTDAQGTAETLTSPATVAVVNVNDLPTGTVSIAGTIAEDQLLTASNTLADIDGLGTVNYQWQESSNGTIWTNIAGATTPTFTLGDAQVGKQIRVAAAYTDGQGTLETVNSTATTAVVNVNDLPTGTVTIAGTATEDQTLTASNTLDDLDGMGVVSYQWQQSPDGNTWTNITDATAATFKLGDAQVNQQIRVMASYTDGRGAVEAVNSLATTAVVNVNDVPSLTGNTVLLPSGTEETVYTIDVADLLVGFTDIDGDALSVTNLNATNGTLVDNGDGTYTFTPTANYSGTINLTYNVIDGNGGSLPATQTFDLAATNDAPTAMALSVSSYTMDENTDIANGVKVADIILADDGVGGNQFQVVGADAASFTVRTDANGTALYFIGTSPNFESGQTSYAVTIEATDPEFPTVLLTQNFTLNVSNINEPVLGTVAIGGDPILGQSLIIFNSLVDDDGIANTSYQWQQSSDGGTTWVDIPGATANRFNPTSAQLNQQLRVSTQITDAQSNVETLFSSATAAVTGIQLNMAALGNISTVGNQAVPGLAADLTAPPYGPGYSYVVTVDRPELFATLPSLSPTGTLTYQLKSGLKLNQPITLTIQLQQPDGTIDPAANRIATLNVVYRPEALVRDDATGTVSLLYIDQVTQLQAVTPIKQVSGQQAIVPDTWDIADAEDFNRDGIADVLLHSNAADEVRLWVMGEAGQIVSEQAVMGMDGQILRTGSQNWQVFGMADIDGDQVMDIVWHNQQDDEIGFWFMGLDGVVKGYDYLRDAAGEIIKTRNVGWEMADFADFDGDGDIDLLFRLPALNQTAIVRLQGKTFVDAQYIVQNSIPNLVIRGLGDANGDRLADIYWQTPNNDQVLVQLISFQDGQWVSGTFLVINQSGSFQLQAIADLDRNNTADLLWRDDSTNGVLAKIVESVNNVPDNLVQGGLLFNLNSNEVDIEEIADFGNAALL
jgi:hypothetical protein